MNLKKSATIIKLNTGVTNLNVRGILMHHCGRDKKPENIYVFAIYEISKQNMQLNDNFTETFNPIYDVKIAAYQT
jgi:hypothetical protein